MIDPAIHAGAVERMAQALHYAYNEAIKDKYGKTAWEMLVESRKERWRHVAAVAFVQTYVIAQEVNREIASGHIKAHPGREVNRGNEPNVITFLRRRAG